MSTEPTQAANADPLLVFRIGTTWLGADAFAISEIIDRVAPIPLPRAPNHLSGVVHLRGRAVPILNVEQYLELPPATQKATGAVFPRIVIVEASEMRVGMPCDEVFGVLPAADCVLSACQLSGGRLAKFAVGELETAKGTTIAIDLPALLEAARVQD